MIMNELCQNSYSRIWVNHIQYTLHRIVKKRKLQGATVFLSCNFNIFMYLIFKVFAAVWTMKKYYVQNIKHLDLFVAWKDS